MPTIGVIGTLIVLAAGVLSAVRADPCADIPDGSATLAGRFTLAARNTTGTQVNATGAPLVIGSVGAIDGEEFYVLVTSASYPYNDWPSLNLTDGGMLAQNAYSDDETSAVGTQVMSNGEVAFITTVPTPAAYKQWCALPSDNADGAQRLAVSGHSKLFTLCPGFKTEVFYNKTGSAAAGCFPVDLLAVPITTDA